MPERDELYASDIANKRPLANTRFHCDDAPEGGWQTSRRDTRDGEHGDENQCEEFNRRLRSGIGAGSNRSLR